MTREPTPQCPKITEQTHCIVCDEPSKIVLCAECQAIWERRKLKS
jgi:hypothetical protein